MGDENAEFQKFMEREWEPHITDPMTVAAYDVSHGVVTINGVRRMLRAALKVQHRELEVPAKPAPSYKAVCDALEAKTIELKGYMDALECMRKDFKAERDMHADTKRLLECMQRERVDSDRKMREANSRTSNLSVQLSNEAAKRARAEDQLAKVRDALNPLIGQAPSQGIDPAPGWGPLPAANPRNY